MIDYGKTIYDILTDAFTGQTGYTVSIYPLVLPENTALPAIVWRRQFNCEYTKDWRVSNNINIDITILTLN